MKIKFLVITLFLFSSQLLFSQINVDDLFRKYSKENEVTKIKLGGFALGLASVFADTKGVKRIELVDLSQCDPDLLADYKSNFSNLKRGDYEPLISHNESGNKTRVFIKTKKDAVAEFLVFIAGDDANLMMQLKGDIKLSDIIDLIQKYAD